MKTPEQIAQENASKMEGRVWLFTHVREYAKESVSLRQYLRIVIANNKGKAHLFHVGLVAEARAQAKAMGVRL